VLEFNCRFGDPETQPIMVRLESDLIDLVEAGLDGKLDRATARWDARVALGVVMAAAGYPGTPRKGDAISGLETPAPAGTKLFHAGTSQQDGKVVTAGGRVLCATALGATVAEAQQRAYALARQVRWDGEFHRHDIGWRALK
jgi:phosphoribosylamine--glycine ligase